MAKFKKTSGKGEDKEKKLSKKIEKEKGSLTKIKKDKKEKIEKKDIEKIEDKEVKKKRTSDRSNILRELKEKAKKLAETIEVVKTEDIKEELAQKRELLIPLEDYVKTGIHLGTKVITPDMKQFVYRRRADSIGVLNTSLIDDHIKKTINFISKYKPEEIILVCKKEAGWNAAKLFSEATGIKVFTKKYPAGMMTNIMLSDFFEPEVVIISDSWIDRNALNDAKRTNKKVVMLADTNNFIRNVDEIIPCNNKGGKSLGLVFWLLARGYIERNKIKSKLAPMDEFVGEDE